MRFLRAAQQGLASAQAMLGGFTAPARLCSMDIDLGDDTLTEEPTVIEELAYRDTWGRRVSVIASVLKNGKVCQMVTYRLL